MDWLGLKEEHRMLRHDIKRFAETELEPKVMDLDKESKPHGEAFEKIGKLGILGILIPEEFGGAGMDLLSLVVTLEELSKVSPSFALSVAAHNLAGEALAIYGSDDVKKQYLPGLAEGKKTAGLGITTMLHAVKEGSEKEQFMINGSFSHLIVFMLAEKEDMQFAIQENAGDLTLESELMGMRASGICSFNPGKQSSSRSTFVMSDPAGFNSKIRLMLAVISCGICGSALAQSISYAKERKQFDRPIATFGMVRIMFAEMAAGTDASRMMVYQAAANGNSLDMDISAAFAVEHALIVTDKGVQVFGGYGYTKDYPLEMYFRDAKMLEIFAGSAGYLKVQIGKKLSK
jgi:alkylation response protein AidB-like acyl-CoA dehydrogenase